MVGHKTLVLNEVLLEVVLFQRFIHGSCKDEEKYRVNYCITRSEPWNTSRIIVGLNNREPVDSPRKGSTMQSFIVFFLGSPKRPLNIYHDADLRRHDAHVTLLKWNIFRQFIISFGVYMSIIGWCCTESYSLVANLPTSPKHNLFNGLTRYLYVAI